MSINTNYLIWFFFVLPIMMTIISILYYHFKRKSFFIKLEFPTNFFNSKVDNNSSQENTRSNINEYIKIRLDPTIKCYDEKALISSILFTCCSIVQIVYSALVPVSLMIATESDNAKMIGAIFGAFVTIASGINVFCKFKEKWLQYLQLRDKLFAQRNSYLMKDDKFKEAFREDFIETCERIISIEHKNIAEMVSSINNDITNKKEIT